MKKLIITILCFAFNHLLNAQTDVYFRIKKLIATTHPEIITDNKLIAFTTWSVNDPESRETNKSFEKIYKTYESARLKGGLKGIVVVAFNNDDLSSMAVITLAKDGITKLLSFKADEIKSIQTDHLSNQVFDSNGNVVYTNLPATSVFTSIHQLITR